MADKPMIVVERGSRSGYGVFADGKLAVASRDAEGALVGVAAVLDVSLLEMVLSDETLQRRALMNTDVAKIAEAVVTMLIEINASDRKIQAIKAIRAVTGCGLKDAKDAMEFAFVRAGMRDSL